MSLKLTFQIAFQSDYHVGAGHGLGTEIDSALLRDADGVLVLRGTLLNGLLREGLMELLEQKSMRHWRDEHPCKAGGVKTATNRFCGQFESGESVALGPLDMCPVCRIFGSPRTPKRWSIGSARPEKQGRVRGDRLQPADVNRQRVMRARVSPRTRRAEPRKLFSQEHGGQQVFEFVAECLADDEAALDEASLLVAAARMVRQLGRGRRRGMGECLITLKEVESEQTTSGEEGVQAYLLKHFQKRWLERTEALAKPKPATLTATRQPEGREVRVRVIAHADEPLLIAQRASAGNQFKTQLAITGKTLRGALAAIAAGTFDLDEPTTRQAFVGLFLRGTVRFPTLYPMGFNSSKSALYPAIPVPCDGFTCKVYPGHGLQWGTQDTPTSEKSPDQVCLKLIPSETEPDKTKQCGQAVKPVRSKFVALDAKDQEPFAPDQRNEMHIQIDRDTGRVAPRQVFEYVPLEAGQYFAGELICTDANAWRLLQQFLGLDPDATGQKVTTVRLGKGRQRGYGRVNLWLNDEVSDDQPLWIGQPLRCVDGKQGRVAEKGAKPSELTLTLLTDTIVADTWGHFVTGFDTGWLSGVLGVEVGDLEIVEQRAYAVTQMVDGFNSIQRLPRWRDVALAAGSSVRLWVTRPPAGGLLEKLQQIEREGIGLRRNEGYGQVVFNHPVYTGGVQNVSVDTNYLPSDLRPGTFGPEAHARFRHEWEKSLRGEKWGACAKPRFRDAFAALARWLVAQQEQPPADLVKVMDVLLAQKEEREAAQKVVPRSLTGTLPALGQPDHDLTTRIIEDYGARDKANKLTQQDAREGMQLIRSKLADLTQSSDWEPFWPEGVAMVAAQVAEVTKKREGE